jgi:hypothetical protein
VSSGAPHVRRIRLAGKPAARPRNAADIRNVGRTVTSVANGATRAEASLMARLVCRISENTMSGGGRKAAAARVSPPEAR